MRRELITLKTEGADPDLGREINGAEWIEDGAAGAAA